MRKFKHTNIMELVASGIYIVGFLAIFTFTIITAINH